MASELKTETNRQNAKLSTGPVTVQGKAVASKNAIKHGVYSSELLLKSKHFSEDPRKLADLRESLLEDLAPEGAMESIIVDRIIGTLWRLRRVQIAELAQFVDEFDRIEKRERRFGAHDIASPSWMDEMDTSHLMETLDEYGSVLSLSSGAFRESKLFQSFMIKEMGEAAFKSLKDGELQEWEREYREICQEHVGYVKATLKLRAAARPKQLKALVPLEHLSKEETRLAARLEKDLELLWNLKGKRTAK